MCVNFIPLLVQNKWNSITIIDGMTTVVEKIYSEVLFIVFDKF